MDSGMIMGQGSSAFASFLPPLGTVRKANTFDDADVAGDVRMGELAACVVTMFTSTMIAYLSKSKVPFYIGLVYCLVLVCIYEYSLQAFKPFQPKNGAPE